MSVSSLKSCFDCHRTKSSRWYRSPENDLARRCEACYQKARAAAKEAEGVSCLDCGIEKSSRWYRNPKNELAHRCNSCYEKARKAIRSTEGAAERRSLKRKKDVLGVSEGNQRPVVTNRRIFLDSEAGLSVNFGEERVFGEMSDEIYPSLIDGWDLFQGLAEQSLFDVVAETVEELSSTVTSLKDKDFVYIDEYSFSKDEDPLEEIIIAYL